MPRYVDDFFFDNFLSATKLAELGQLLVKVTGIEEDQAASQAGKPPEDIVVMRFERISPNDGKQQKLTGIRYKAKLGYGLILQKVLARGIAGLLHQPDMDQWVGATIVLYTERLPRSNKASIRARLPKSPVPEGGSAAGGGK